MTLLSLPDELLLNIIKLSDPDDLFALRLVCRKLSKACSDELCSQYFKYLRVDYNQAGLRRLVNIVSRPHLLKKLDAISFEAAALHLLGLAYSHDNGTFCALFSHPRRQWEVPRVVQWCGEDVKHPLECFLAAKIDLKLLQLAFQNLRAAKASPMIALNKVPWVSTRNRSQNSTWNSGFTLRSLLSASVDAAAPRHLPSSI